MKSYNITIVGAGYVGSSLAALLSSYNKVNVIDNDINKIKNFIAGSIDSNNPVLQKYFKKNKKNLTFLTSFKSFIQDTDYLILALPTNFKENENFFDTSSIETTIEEISKMGQLNTNIIIKSTAPIGFTKKIQEKYKHLNIFYAPEFLRENHAIQDNINPSRIIIGSNNHLQAINLSKVFEEISENNPPIYIMSSCEAESVKLFSNSYLATRVSFFNELDTFCLERELDISNVINGISSDPRIQFGYNNPSFGYGGNCLPKDTKQLLANFKDVPQDLFSAVINSNKKRKQYIAKKIIDMKPKRLGVYRLVMKLNSDNTRESAVVDILEILKQENIEILIYEPLLKNFNGFYFERSIEKFKSSCDLIIANRFNDQLDDVKDKVFTRDVFRAD